MKNDSPNEIEPLSCAGVEEVRRHPASRAELALVATIDQLREENKTLRAENESLNADIAELV